MFHETLSLNPTPCVRSLLQEGVLAVYYYCYYYYYYYHCINL